MPAAVLSYFPCLMPRACARICSGCGKPGMPEAFGPSCVRVVRWNIRAVWTICCHGIDKTPRLDLSGPKVHSIFGQGANGHIDEYMRFVNDSTLFVGVIDPEEKNAIPSTRSIIQFYKLTWSRSKMRKMLQGIHFTS